MTRRKLFSLVVGSIVLVLAVASAAAGTKLSVDPYLSGLALPVHAISSGVPGDGRLFIVEQDGLIRLAKNGALESMPFLDLTDRIALTRNYGLFGLAFHPDFPENRSFYVHYIYSPDGATTHYSRISRFQVPVLTPDAADRTTEEVLLTIPFNGPGHWAGDIAFGPDGFLYIPFGDGDPAGNAGTMEAQNLSSLAGKLMRIDVNYDPDKPAADCKGFGTGQYNLPPDNPYLTTPAEACGEIWASGLRNPWRLSFDSETGDLFLSDVGEDRFNEINHEPAGSPGGRNYGWPCYEANEAFIAPGTEACLSASAYDFPDMVVDIVDGGDCSTTGGYVYRGAALPGLAGKYIFGDFCSGAISAATLDGGDWTVERMPAVAPFDIVSFGQRSDGELVVVNRSAGTVSRLIGLPEEGLSVTLSTTGSGTISASPPMPYSGADVLMRQGGSWSKPYPAAAAGTTRNVRAYATLGPAHLLVFNAAQLLNGAAGPFTASPRDVVAYTPGAPVPFALFLDGEDVGLGASGEAIDALAVDPLGRVVISTIAGASVPCDTAVAGCPATGNLPAQDEDLLVFNPGPGHTGSSSVGKWALYFNGTAVPGLRVEDVGGASISPDGTLYLSVYDAFTVGGQKGNARSIFTVTPAGSGFLVRIVWRGTDFGLTSSLDAIEVRP